MTEFEEFVTYVAKELDDSSFQEQSGIWDLDKVKLAAWLQRYGYHLFAAGRAWRAAHDYMLAPRSQLDGLPTQAGQHHGYAPQFAVPATQARINGLLDEAELPGAQAGYYERIRREALGL